MLLLPNRRGLLGAQWCRERLWRMAGEVPSFHIAPARTGHARDLITGSVLGTYNSASPAWAVGPDGVLALPTANAPVIEYDPVTLACLGARIWGVVTNLFTYNSTFTDASWSKSNLTITANSATSPAGTTDASLVSPLNSGSQIRNFRQTYTTSTAGTYTFSIYVKINTLTSGFIALRIRNQSGLVDAYSNWDTNTFLFGSVAALGGWTGSTSVQQLKNGWFRLSLTVTTTSSSHTALVSELWPGGYAGTLDTIGSPLVWGAQFQAGTLGPYVPTTTTTASSTADVWSITGADFSRIINQTEGTIYIEYGPHDATTPATNNSLFTITTSMTSAANIIESFAGGNVAAVLRVESNGVNQAYMSSSAYSPSAIHKLAAAYKVDDFARSIDTQSIGTDTSGALPAVAPSILEIGTRNFGGVKPLNGYIRELAILRTRRPNANLQAMTQ